MDRDEKMERISVIMSCFNEEERWLRSSIESILKQTYKNFEFIIILDKPDNTELKNILFEYKEKDYRVKIIMNSKNIGLIKSLNKGLKIATGDFIARMDADDISEIDRLEKQIQYLKKNEKIDLVSGLMTNIDEDGKVIGFTTMPKMPVKKQHFIRNYVSHPTWMFRKKLLDKVKCYKEVEYAEDYDFSIRALISGARIEVMNENILKYRIRGNGISVFNELKQILTADIIRREYFKSILLGKEYKPERKLKKLAEKDFTIAAEQYKSATKLYVESRKREKNKANKVFTLFKYSLKSKEFFKIHVLNGIENRVVKIIVSKMDIR